MADLTPPSSKKSTPLRPTNQPEPPSPTPHTHPLATSTTSASTTNQPNDMSSSDVDERASQADGDEEMGLDDDVMEIQEMVGQDGRGKGQGVTARGKAKRSRQKSGPAPARRERTVGETKGKGKKDDGLYESDIVARWNSSFGDVCLDTPAPASKAYG